MYQFTYKRANIRIFIADIKTELLTSEKMKRKKEKKFKYNQGIDVV